MRGGVEATTVGRVGRGMLKGGVGAATVGSVGRGTPKRDTQERAKVAGMGDRAVVGGRGDVERDPQVQNVEGGKG